MPRKTFALRFDPRAGVNQRMLEMESIALGREFQHHREWSINELRKRLRERQEKLQTTGTNVQAKLEKLPDRERLALRSMMVRDFFHIAALYETFMGVPAVENATGHRSTIPEEQSEDRPLPIVPFSEWLFE